MVLTSHRGLGTRLPNVVFGSFWTSKRNLCAQPRYKECLSVVEGIKSKKFIFS